MPHCGSKAWKKLRLNTGANPDELDFGRFRIQPAQRQLLVDEAPAKLGARAFDVLQALIERRERVVSKDELLELVWPGLVVEENNLQVHISALRKLLGPQAIATIPGRGYRFTLRTEVAAEAFSGSSAAAGPHAPDNQQAGAPAHTGVVVDFPGPKLLATRANNLPQQLTRFIGRAIEIAAIEALLTRTRLLTLTGSGGCGKTRLSLEVATGTLNRFADGAWFIELAPLVDPELVPQAIAMVLGVKEVPGTPISQTLTEHLKSKQLLLLLDNCEHLLDACTDVADALARYCPGIRILASSRETLGVGGEQCYRVPSLSLPDREEAPTPQNLTRYESVQLFVDRAQLLREDFKITGDNAPALASLCRRLDGIPLAIELAAARVRALSVEEIDGRLEQRFLLLTSGSRMALPRHQTLRALIDWSYDLLHEPERLLLQRLSVFAGGWMLAAAEAVCAGEDVAEGEVLDRLTLLCDKNLVVISEKDGKTRYRLLETVRQYVLEKLKESGDETAVQKRHRDYFLALAEEAEPKLVGPDQAAWLRRLDEEHENLLAALGWSLTEAESRGGLRFCTSLHRFWVTRGHFAEGWEWCRRILGKPGKVERSLERAHALAAAGGMAWYIGDPRANQAWRKESLAIARELGDRRGIANALFGLGSLATAWGDVCAGRARHEEALDIMQDLGDQRGIAVSLHGLANVALWQSDYPAAQALLERSLTIARQVGDRRLIAFLLRGLGLVAFFREDLSTSWTLLEDCLAVARRLGDETEAAAALCSLGTVAHDRRDLVAAHALHRESLALGQTHRSRLEITDSLEGLGEVASALGGPLRAARIWGAAERLREEVGFPLPPVYQRRHDLSVAAARAALDDPAVFDRAWQEGHALPLEKAIELGLEEMDGQR